MNVKWFWGIIITLDHTLPVYGFPEYLALWARLKLMALPGKLERNRSDEVMNREKSWALWALISPIQAISLLFVGIQKGFCDVRGVHIDLF